MELFRYRRVYIVNEKLGDSCLKKLTTLYVDRILNLIEVGFHVGKIGASQIRYSVKY